MSGWSIVLIVIGVLAMITGVVLVRVGAGENDDLMSLGGLFVFVMGVLLTLTGAGVLEGDPGCEEYGTVMVIVDGDERCVPWEQAPDLQDFPQP